MSLGTKANFGRGRTSRYSDKMRSSTSTVRSPARTRSRMRPGGPRGLSNPDTSTFVSRTILKTSVCSFDPHERGGSPDRSRSSKGAPCPCERLASESGRPRPAPLLSRWPQPSRRDAFRRPRPGHPSAFRSRLERDHPWKATTRRFPGCSAADGCSHIAWAREYSMTAATKVLRVPPGFRRADCGGLGRIGVRPEIQNWGRRSTRNQDFSIDPFRPGS